MDSMLTGKPVMRILLATSIANSRLLRAKILYRMMAQKLAAPNIPRILLDMDSGKEASSLANGGSSKKLLHPEFKVQTKAVAYGPDVDNVTGAQPQRGHQERGHGGQQLLLDVVMALT